MQISSSVFLLRDNTASHEPSFEQSPYLQGGAIVTVTK